MLRYEQITYGFHVLTQQRLPLFSIPQTPFNWEMLQTVFPYAIAISFVGLLESFLTANVVDELTDTPSNKNREAYGQGVANIVSGFFAV